MWRVEPTMSTARTVMMLRSEVVALPTAILSPHALYSALNAKLARDADIPPSAWSVALTSALVSAAQKRL